MKISNKQERSNINRNGTDTFFILVIVFGITEFARAWFTKNSLKNAARHRSKSCSCYTSHVTLILRCPNASHS